MRENRWNEAVARPLDFGSEVQKKRQKLSPLKTLPVSEKLIYLFSVVLCVCLALIVLSRYAKVTELSVAIQKTQIQIEEREKQQLQLKMEKNKLQSVERIRKFAESQGLELSSPKLLPSVRP